MEIIGKGTETFLYLNGLGVTKQVRLGKNIELLPVTCTIDSKIIMDLSKDQGEYGVALIFLWLVKSQLHIISGSPKLLAKDAWNSLWDVILLSAIFNCDAVCNFQCNKPAEEITNACDFRVTNHQLRGLTQPMYYLNDEDIAWINEYFSNARNLLEQSKFLNAVHCLATYHWHTLPNAQLALLWSGIEGLFDINSELVFRLSLYIARFLEVDNEEIKKMTFNNVKKLYNQRSAAVHGAGKIADPNKSVDDSAQLLRKLILQCINNNNLPIIDDLAP
ncbi:MAG: hypothetical protein ABSE06_13720 [Anaerolineaceae bacterium]|jgi:hypothetical protein